MGVPTSEVGYTSATAGRGDHEIRKGHVVALGEKKNCTPNFIGLFTKIAIIKPADLLIVLELQSNPVITTLVYMAPRL
jgi:hypothetical protein